MTKEQMEALEALDAALEKATEIGALDVVQDYCNNPDSINDFCDAVENAIMVS